MILTNEKLKPIPFKNIPVGFQIEAEVLRQRLALCSTGKPRVIKARSSSEELLGQRRHRVDTPLRAINHQ